jgi:signal transduction histidine kinase
LQKASPPTSKTLQPLDNKQAAGDDDSLYWRFDAHTFRLLGRELITDRITAVFELVKNCYDANAKEVTVNFHNVTAHLEDRKITITDNGHGMSFEDIRDKWMVVGTKSKRVGKRYSAAPFKRRFVGEKGIGRFAVDKLGERLIIKTKKKGEQRRLRVNINWDEYEEASKKKSTTLFTEIKNIYSYEPADKDEQGTTLEVLQVREIWTKNDIDRLYKELTKVVSPFATLKPPFQIYITSNEHKEYRKKLVVTDAIAFSSANAAIGFHLPSKEQEVLKFNEETGEIYKVKQPYKSFGPVSMRIFYFDENAKRRYNAAHKNDDSTIDGIKIYRDGVITTPFAEFEAHRDKKRDILGIDKRLWSGSFDKVGTREFIGIVNISKALNPRITDSTNRQDFIDNKEYRDLKEFVIEQIDVFSKLKVFNRAKSNLATATALRKADRDVSGFNKKIAEIEKQNPELKSILEPLKKQSEEVESSLKKGIIAQEKTQQEFIRRENIYLSLMSLQDYAIHISHAVRTSLGKIKRMAEYFKKNFPNAKLDDLFKEYAVQIYKEMDTLAKVIDFMLSYAGSNLDFEDFSVKALIEELLLGSYSRLFEDEDVNVTVEIRDDFTIHANKNFVLDIIQNLVSNSIKALQDVSDRKIKCSGYLESDCFILYFSDNGSGIKKGDEERIFDIYYTTTAEQGGAGLGLFIVKTRIEALKGTIEVVPQEFRPSGTTFKITLPFKKE